MDDVLDLILDAMKNEDYFLISVILLSVVSIWLYSEFRKSYIENKSEDKLYINTALEHYSKLFFGIIAFQSGTINSNELLGFINQAIVYLPKEITKELLELAEFNLDNNSSKLNTMKIIIKDEIIFIKSKQFTITTYDYKENMFEQASWFLSKNNFDSFIKPFVYFIFTLIGLMGIIIIVISLENLTGYSKLNFYLFIINIACFLLVFINLIDLTFKKRLNLIAWKYFFSLIVIPLVLTLSFFKHSILNTITIVIFFITLLDKKLLTPKQTKGD